MKHTEFWSRLESAVGSSYAQSWASDQVIGGLGGRTVLVALGEGVPPKEVWREVWRVLDLPVSER